MTRRAVTASLGLALTGVFLATGAPAGEGSLSSTERKLLRDPEAARQEVLRRMEKARDALAALAPDPRGRFSLPALQRELAKAQQAIESEDYKAAYVFTRRVERRVAASQGMEP